MCINLISVTKLEELLNNIGTERSRERECHAEEISVLTKNYEKEKQELEVNFLSRLEDCKFINK